MAQDMIPLGPVPARESAAQVGESGYAERAFFARANAIRCDREAPTAWEAVRAE
jgi:hypothetical protein